MMQAREWLPLRVRAVRLETPSVRSFELVSADGSPLPAWTPGAHIDLQLGNGLTRQYSLCGDPAERAWRIAVKRAPASRGGSAWLHDALLPGATLQAGAPRNAFAFDPSARRVVLVAAGIGITPLLPMWHAARRLGLPVTLHYAPGSEAAFAEALEGVTDVHFHAGPGRDAVTTSLDAALPAWEDGARLYTCGPAGFMDQVFTRAASRGWPEAALHREHFAPAQSCAAAAQHAAPVAEAVPVFFVHSGVQALAAPGEALLAVARRHRIDIGTGCEQGLCGACMTAVHSGAPEHRDSYLSDAERERWVLPCVSGCGTQPLELAA
jgi:vanillate O-demethylase ferredoxin subunit